MIDTPHKNNQLAEYRLAVERQLGDLPATVRADLLDDLEAHLVEVAAELEPGVSLESRLGPAAEYGRELRETAEMRAESRAALLEVLRPAANGLRTLPRRFTTSAGMGDPAQFLKALKPGWWVLRGVIVAVLAVYLVNVYDDRATWTLVNAAWFSALGMAAFTLLCVWLSLRLGTSSERWSGRSQVLVALGGAGLVAIAVWAFFQGMLPFIADLM